MFFFYCIDVIIVIIAWEIAIVLGANNMANDRWLHDK